MTTGGGCVQIQENRRCGVEARGPLLVVVVDVAVGRSNGGCYCDVHPGGV